MFWLNMETADAGRLRRVHRASRQREGHHGGQPDRADHGDGQAVLADLVPVQRAEPDHPDACRLGPDRVRAEQLRHHGQRLHGGVQLPERPGQGPEQLRGLAAVERRGRAVEAERVQRRRARHVRAEQVLLRPGQAEAGGVPGGAVHHRRRRVRRAAVAELQHQDRRRLPAAAGRAAPSRPTRPSARTRCPATPWPRGRLGHQLLRGELPVHHRQRPDHQAAVLPPGAGVPDEPGRGDPGAAARLRHDHGRPGRQYPGDRVPVAEGQGGQPVPVRPGQGQVPADQPRLEGGPERRDHLHRPEPVRAGDQEGPGAELHPAVRDRDRVDRVGDDAAAVQRGRGRDQAEPGAQAVQPGDRDRRRQLRGRQAPRATGTWPTGAAAGRSPRTTCPPARSCSCAARSRTRAGTATRRTTR